MDGQGAEEEQHQDDEEDRAEHRLDARLPTLDADERIVRPAVTRMSSSNLSWTALLSLFWVFWMRNTIKNVMIVVPVLTVSCQPSE
jgi:hypothetical protein